MLNVQVAGQLHLLGKQDVGPEALKTFLAAVSKARATGDKHKASTCPKMAATKLACPSTLAWLEGMEKQLSESLLSATSVELGQLKQMLSKANTVCYKVGPPTEESKYRDNINKLKADMAGAAQKLKGAVSNLETTAAVLSSLVEPSKLEPLEAGILSGRAWAAELSSHITWFACLTCFRSPTAGEKSQQSKTTASKLVHVLQQLLPELSKVPETDRLPTSLVLSQGLEMVAVDSRRLLSGFLNMTFCFVGFVVLIIIGVIDWLFQMLPPFSVLGQGCFGCMFLGLGGRNEECGCKPGQCQCTSFLRRKEESNRRHGC